MSVTGFSMKLMRRVGRNGKDMVHDDSIKLLNGEYFLKKIERRSPAFPRALKSATVILITAFLVPFISATAYEDAPEADGERPSARPNVESMSEFERIPVLHNGRKMPLHSYARLMLIQFSGRHSYDGMEAIEWLARVLFTPERTLEDRVFIIDNPEVARAIGIDATERERYSFADLHSGMSRLRELAMRASRLESDDRSHVERELIRLYANVTHYLDLYYSFEFARAHPDFHIESGEHRELLGFPEDRTDYRFVDHFFNAEKIQELITPLADKPQDEWSEMEQLVFGLSNSLYTWTQRYQGLPFTIIPLLHHDEETWLSPWDVLGLGFRDQTLNHSIRIISEMTEAYRNGQQLEFDMAAREFSRMTHSLLPDDREMSFLAWEVRLNKLDPFVKGQALYLLAFLVGFVSLLVKRPFVMRAGIAVLLIGFLLHTAGMLSRMIIMGRPPMTNLYSTFIFVGWACVVLGIILEYYQRNSLGLLISGLSGWALLVFSGRHLAEGDTMGQVVAVLDSNFWLSTHVTTITVGYAGCLLAGILGHAYIIQAMVNHRNDPKLKSIYNAMIAFLGFGLTFSFLGTMLGGVWADQSWGRFWGWDPKENGALLIVLWCSVLFHAKIGNMIGNVMMAAGCIVLMIVVMMAWLGVNLLGVGLHSYGFTSGLASNLFIYTAAEILFVAIMVPLVKRKTGPVEIAPSSMQNHSSFGKD